MNPLQKLVDYLKSVRAEMLKVSWPSRRETVRYSSLVIGISVLVAVFFAGLDVGFTKLFELGLSARSSFAAKKELSKEQPAATTTEQKPTLDFSDVTPITTPTDTSTKK